MLAGLVVFAGLFMLPEFELAGLFMFMFPPALVFAGVITGVGVLTGVGDIVVFVEFVVLFEVSLPQPAPRAARASKVRRAKVLRIELSPVTQRVRLLGSWIGSRSRSDMQLPLQLGQLIEPHGTSYRHEKFGSEPKLRGRLIIHNRVYPLLSRNGRICLSPIFTVILKAHHDRPTHARTVKCQSIHSRSRGHQ